MFMILLKFGENKSQAGPYMDSHKAWINRGREDGVFLMVGSLQPNAGGAILAHNASLQDIQDRVDADPFVKENIVNAEILEVTPNMADERLQFLLD